MGIRVTFRIQGAEFVFVNQKGGKEDILAGNDLLSSQTTVTGGKHKFFYNGSEYEIKVKPGMFKVGFAATKNGKKVKVDAEKLPVSVYLIIGWPLVLMLTGGAIGGALGGLAAGVNALLYRSKLPVYAKVVLNILTGAVAITIWFFVAVAVQTATK